MATTTLLLDHRPAYLRSPRRPTSLLLLPLGPATGLDFLRRHLPRAAATSLTVLTTFPADDAYVAAAKAVVPDAAVIGGSQLVAFLNALEPSDCVLLVDARYLPATAYAQQLLVEGPARAQLARHLVLLRQEQDGLCERVICDEAQRVRKIQRFYDGVTHLELAAVSAALVSAPALRLAPPADLLNLTRLRARLTTAGVPSEDVAVHDPALDLLRLEDLLAAHERITCETVRQRAPLPFKQRRPDIWVGPGCQIHAASRLCGPLIVHANVRIDAAAVIVGPTVLGAGARIEHGALISQSVIGPAVRVLPDAIMVCDVAVSGTERTSSPAGKAGWRASCQACRVPHFEPAAGDAKNVDRRRGQRGNSARRRYRQLLSGAGVKRACDFALAAAGLLLLSPLFVVVAALVKLTSRGPVFFCHLREGRGGRVFRCWKFRTMVDGAHAQQRALYRTNELDGPQFKLANDPRITRLGDWLRTTNIDELPQLINVLRGEMSLIGPRPSPFRENQICVPWRNARLSVRPGITGLWQVCRRDRETGDFHQWIWLDILYVRHWSLGMDVRIFLATLVTLGGRWSVPLTWIIPAQRLRSQMVQAGPFTTVHWSGFAAPRLRQTEITEVFTAPVR